MPNTSSQPVKLFSESMSSLKSGTENVLGELAPSSEDRFKSDLYEELDSDDLEEDEESLLESMLIGVDLSTLTVNKVPLFLKLDQFKIGISQISESLVSYSLLLMQLQNPNLISQDAFDSLAKDLNANTYQAVRSMKTTSGTESNEKIALFSQLAISATKTYLQSRQKSELAKALKKNQPTVTSFAKTMQDAISILARITKLEYDQNARDLAKKAIVQSSRNHAIAELIVLDRSYIQQIKTLNDLHQAYGKVPAAHAELVNALRAPSSSLPAIINMIETGKRLQSKYEQSLAINKSEDIQAQANKASAQASVMEAEAATAALQSATADVSAVKARIEAEADLDNTNKQKRAEELEKIAMKLKEMADKKQTQATKLRAVADVVQERADKIKLGLLSTQ